MKQIIFTFLIALGLMALLSNAAANNIQISNTKLTGQNTAEGYTLVQFDLSWENSRRINDLNDDGVTNWDAAWVFVKYRMLSFPCSCGYMKSKNKMIEIVLK
jgi:sensor domain CHASE-containing protein